MRPRRLVLLALAIALVAVVAPAGAAQAAITPARVALSNLTLAQRVGQLFMVGTPADGSASAGASHDAAAQIGARHVGGVILTGRSRGGITATAALTTALQGRTTWNATAGVPLLVAADQEGGQVQVLSGPGFSVIPTALTQGGWSTSQLRTRAAEWGGQLRKAGVNLDLAPVYDTVPSPGYDNPPIGRYDREFGFDPATVATHANAFSRGLADARVSATAKHFPGLGRVHANTDTTAGVTDPTTTRNDAYVRPFRDAVQAGVPFLMMSTAVYSRIDAQHPAAFSHTVVTGMARGDLGFGGVIISDDLGNAKQVASVKPGDRAVQFVDAGGDLVLTVNPDVLPAMYDAVLARAQHDAGFRALVDAAALRVLQAKDDLGLLRHRTLIRHRWPIPLGQNRG